MKLVGMLAFENVLPTVLSVAVTFVFHAQHNTYFENTEMNKTNMVCIHAYTEEHVVRSGSGPS